ncbi:CelD/BcsL family acetyltransferase involved in cellulose biosynthesis [Kineococcus radiotolerans]|uniref:CelD/BcsL family acetyltransferase involved in cellulose biosynthesis n=1 Tax=Kineococcus radiotolerans TaxID=131568 RepID=A0A7W4TKC7_KINRA|nr:GNAT family N-acetyltransferase [Kineococcus radiotolerans]MBB2900208.1 CelD/BcsL family acetyltransferase involved in cellulose biosynthesis [Kineococcus radiotolerans]
MTDALALETAGDLALVRDPAHGLSVTVRRGLEGAPVPEWRALAARAGQPPFTGPDWLRAVHTHLGAGEPLLVSVRRDGRLLALGAFTVLPGSRPLLTFLGAGASDYAAVLADPDAGVPTSRLVAAVVDGALREVPGALLDLEQVPAEGELPELVAEWARARGYTVRTLRQATVHALPLPATVEEHDTRLGRHARHEERRQWRRLAELGDLVVVDDLLHDVVELRERDPDAAADHLDELVAELAEVDDAHPRAAHRRRPWRGASGRTLTEVLRTTPPGVVQLSGLRLDGELVAYAFCLAGPTALHGYVQSYRARYAATGPGTLLLLRIRRRALVSGYRELDLLRGDEAYKRRLDPTTRHTVRLLLAPATREPLPALVDRVSLLRRSYRDELRRHERIGRGVDAVSGAAERVLGDLARRRAALPRPTLPRPALPRPALPRPALPTRGRAKPEPPAPELPTPKPLASKLPTPKLPAPRWPGAARKLLRRR